MIGSGGGELAEEERRQANIRAMRELAGYEQKDEVRADRGDLLESLGAHGSITFGFLLSGVPERTDAVRCTAAVTSGFVVLLDDEPAGDWQVIARIPREGLDIQIAEPPPGVKLVDVGISDGGEDVEPSDEEVGAQVLLKWPTGEIAVGFATPEGAQEAADLLRRKLNDQPTDMSDPGGTMPA